MHTLRLKKKQQQHPNSSCSWLQSNYLDLRVLAGYLFSCWKGISYRDYCRYKSKPQQTLHIFPFCVQFYAEVMGIVVIQPP